MYQNLFKLLGICTVCFSLCINASAETMPQTKVPQTAELFASLRNGRKKVARLIADGADLTVRDENGMTPFLAAAASGNLAVVRLLMKAGCDVNALDNNENNAMLLAVKSGSHELVRFFIAQGGYDINWKNGYGLTPLMIAAEGGESQLIQILLEAKADSSLTDKKGRSLLMMAASSYNLSLLRSLVERGNADVNAKDSMGRPLLSYAMHHGEMARYLIEAGVNIARRYIAGEQGYQNITPMIDAVVNNNWQAVRALLQKKVDINQSADYGVTPDLAAALSRQWELLEFLMEQGSRLDARLSGIPADKGGNYLNGADSILLAALGSQEELVCRLVADNGAYAKTSSSTGLTPLIVAVARELQDMEACLRKAGATLSEEQKVQVETMRVSESRDAAVYFVRSFKSSLDTYFANERSYPDDAKKFLSDREFNIPEGVRFDYIPVCQGAVCSGYRMQVLSEAGRVEFLSDGETGKTSWRELGKGQWIEMPQRDESDNTGN